MCLFLQRGIVCIELLFEMAKMLFLLFCQLIVVFAEGLLVDMIPADDED